MFSSFNDVGHSADAREMTKDYIIGEISHEETETQQEDYTIVPDSAEKQESWLEILTSPVS